MSAGGNSMRGAPSSLGSVSATLSSSCAGTSRGRSKSALEIGLGANVVIGRGEVEIARQPPERSRYGRVAGETGGFRPRRFGGKAPEKRQDFVQRGIVAPFAFVDDRLHQRQLDPVADLAGAKLDRRERSAERGQDFPLKSGSVRERGKSLAPRIPDESGDSAERRAGQFRQRPRKEIQLPAEQRAQQQGRSQRSACAQSAHKLRSVALRA